MQPPSYQHGRSKSHGNFYSFLVFLCVYSNNDVQISSDNEKCDVALLVKATRQAD
jgi:hypothetical protein